MNSIYQNIKKMKRRRTRRSCARCGGIEHLRLLLLTIDQLGTSEIPRAIILRYVSIVVPVRPVLLAVYTENQVQIAVAVDVSEAYLVRTIPEPLNESWFTLGAFVGELGHQIVVAVRPVLLAIVPEYDIGLLVAIQINVGVVVTRRVTTTSNKEQGTEHSDQKNCLFDLHQNLLLFGLEMCHRDNMSRLLSHYKCSILWVRSQVQTKTSISAVSCLKSYEFNDLVSNF